MQRELIGRQDALHTLKLKLEQAQLCVIVGPGGCGKSALAQAVFQAHPGPHRWWCSLGRCTTRDQLIEALAKSLQLSLFSQEIDQDPAELIERFFAQHVNAGALCVLDDVEGCLDDLLALLIPCAERGSLPALLITSRHQLPIGEHLAISGLEPQDAEALFLARATSAGASRDALTSNPAALATLLARLDHLPLALELFASCAGLFDLETLLAELDQVAAYASPTGLDAPHHHRSLEIALTRSWQLLEPAQREFLSQCAIFQTSFDLDAARQVIALDPLAPNHFGLVASLRSRSLLEQDPGAPGCWAPYQSVRRLLLPSYDAQPIALRQRYARCFIARAQRLSAALDGPKAAQALPALKALSPELTQIFSDEALEPPLRLQAQLSLYKLRMRVGPSPLLIEQLDAAVALANQHQQTPLEFELRIARLQAVNLLSLIARIREDANALDRMEGLTPTQRVDVQLWGASDMVCTGRMDEARAIIDALAAQQEHVTPAQRTMILVAAMVIATTDGRWDRARALDALIEAHRNLATTTIHDQLALMRAQSIWLALHEESAQRVAELCEDMLRLVDLLVYESVRPEILTQAALAYTQLGLHERARSAFEEAIDKAELCGMYGTQSRALLHLGRDLWLGLRDPWPHAQSRIEEAKLCARHAGMRGRELRCDFALVDVWLARQEHERAVLCLASLSLEIAQISYHDAESQLEHRHALSAFLHDNPRHAIARWRKLAASAGPLQSTANLYLMAALACDGELDEAEALRAQLPALGQGTWAARHRRRLLELFLVPRIHRQEALQELLSAPFGCVDRHWLGPMLGMPSPQHIIAPDEPATPELAAPVLLIGPEAAWFQLPDADAPVSLERKAVLAQILEGFAIAQQKSPGLGLSVEQIMALGWPGQQLLPKAGANRVYVALNNLRKLGLDPFMIRSQQGYMLSPLVQVSWADAPRG